VRWAVLVLPKLSMPTPEVYRRFDAMKLGSDEAIVNEPDWNRWTQMGSEELLPRLVNDLETPAFDIAPVLGDLRNRAEQLLGRTVRMSGSGSSLFTLYDDQANALKAAEIIARKENEPAIAVEVAPEVKDCLDGEYVEQ
jgi:4-diphosphocytidyl-2-C-methyl-D-erythritol kinase